MNITLQHIGDPLRLIGYKIGEYVLTEHRGHGKNGVVYRAENPAIGETLACKIVCTRTLKDGWEDELKKVVKLRGIQQVAGYIGRDFIPVNNEPCVCIFSEFVDGQDLREYIKANRDYITVSFIEAFVDEVLNAFYAMEKQGISHGDLHEGNILIAPPDPRLRDQFRAEKPQIKITDFGLAHSRGSFRPMDDYQCFAGICHKLLECLDPSKLEGRDKFTYEKYITFADREILETDPTVGDYVRNPDVLIDHWRAIESGYDNKIAERPAPTLRHPFDYLSCERIGDSFELLRTLYSLKFLGNKDLVERTNTVLTGPRGCGKTTVFRNLSLKAKLLSGTQANLDADDYIGVYYQAKDLYYAFPYLKRQPTQEDLCITLHYFNLAILSEILDTLIVVQQAVEGKIKREELNMLEGFMKGNLTDYAMMPEAPPLARLRHMHSSVQTEKIRVKRYVETGDNKLCPRQFLGVDFLNRLCRLLKETIRCLGQRPFYFFIDDYSLPKVAEPIQMSVNRVIFDRYADCYFKISTESVTTLYPYDADGKLLEETREYDLIDLGDYFLFSSKRKDKEQFIIDVINGRLSHAKNIHPCYHDIRDILGKRPYSNNELARQIAASKHVFYHGLDTLVDLCSGDVASILRIVHDMFAQVEGGLDAFSQAGAVNIPISPATQDKAIREFSASFLNHIEYAPETGKRLRAILDAFGHVANWALRNLVSKNVKGKPPKQAFRIELLSTPYFEDEDLLRIYSDLLRYGAFVRDVRGKSQRGAVVPRLYLRRLLIPTFRLTFSQRDHIQLSVEDFYTLLRDPDKFEKEMMKKRRPELPPRKLWDVVEE